MSAEVSDSGFGTSAGPASRRRPQRFRAIGVLAVATLAISGCAGSFTRPATEVTDTTATLRGYIADPEEGTTTVTYWFEYGPTKSYGGETPQRSIEVSDGAAHPVSEPVAGLDPGTTYHYRACAKQPVKVCAADRKFTTSGGPNKVSITAPSLYPDFKPSIRDYVLNCTGGQVEITAEVPGDIEVSIDGGPARNGTFTTQVSLQPNQRFSFTRSNGSGQSTHHVRCLPADFPEWSFDEYGESAWQWYIVSLGGAYAVIFDGNGVPVWWFHEPTRSPNDAKYLDDGTLAWSAGSPPTKEIRALDGSLINTLTTVGTELDGHDLQLLDNGNYLLMSYKPRAGTVDLTAFGGPADATVIDAELQEVEPDGDLVWSWNSKDHIELAETDHWFDDFGHNNGYDVVHVNSAEVTNGSVVVSMRHTDGVYKIDRTTGDIIWKLGGTTTPESLTVVDDPLAPDPFGGQHDARMHPDGTLTVFDNGQTRDRPPRAVRYQIDEAAGTATLLESVSDPDAPAAICCGSARRSDSGSWVVAWGGLGATDHPVSEFAADGTQTFKLSFPGAFSYRANPVPFGELGRAALRNGMDAQHPR